jgi:hypothetical protein
MNHVPQLSSCSAFPSKLTALALHDKSFQHLFIDPCFQAIQCSTFVTLSFATQALSTSCFIKLGRFNLMYVLLKYVAGVLFLICVQLLRFSVCHISFAGGLAQMALRPFAPSVASTERRQSTSGTSGLPIVREKQLCHSKNHLPPTMGRRKQGAL